VQKIPSVVVYVPVGADLGSVAAVRPIFDALINALLAIGVVVAAVGVGGAVLLHAHTRVRHGVLRLVVEVLVALVLGILVGAVVGTRLADALVSALDSDLVHLVQHIEVNTYLVAAGLVLAVGAIAGFVGGMRAKSEDARPAS